MQVDPVVQEDYIPIGGEKEKVDVANKNLLKLSPTPLVSINGTWNVLQTEIGEGAHSLWCCHVQRHTVEALRGGRLPGYPYFHLLQTWS